MFENEAQIEALIDRRVQARLATDRDYLFAENAEQQALAERKIELQEERAVLVAAGSRGKYRVEGRIEEIDVELEEIAEEFRNL
jgi:hypothetical protein